MNIIISLPRVLHIKMNTEMCRFLIDLCKYLYAVRYGIENTNLIIIIPLERMLGKKLVPF